MSNKGNDNNVDLSALSFGPSWARDEKPKKDYSEYTPKEGAKSRRGNFKKGPGKSSGNRDSRGPKRDSGSRRDFKPRDRGPRVEQIPAPEGFTAEVMPVEEGLDNLAKQIQQTARTYSVFDLARLVLQSRERFNVGLKAPKDSKVFRNFHTFATYLTKEEAIADLWQAENLSRFYQEVQQEVEAPSGNFTTVARCKKSGVYLGPPNLHNYQTKLRDLHRERFSTLPFELFQRNIETLNDEDSINAWIESEKTQTYYLPLDGTEPKAVEAKKEEIKDEKTPEEKEEGNTETPVVEDASQVEINTDDLIKTRAEVEQHFTKNHFDKVYKQVQISWVPSSIPKRLLSPGLFTLLKEVISEEKRYPGKLSSLMCRQLSGRNIAVFKLQKKLKAGPSRPHAIPAIDSLSKRPQALLQWALANDGKGIDLLWKDLLPKDVSEEEKAQWYHDLKWLLTQGFLSLMEEGQIFYSKKQENAPAKDKPKAETNATETPADKKPEEPKTEENSPKEA